MKAGAFTILLTAVMTSMSFTPDRSAEAAAGQPLDHEAVRQVEPMMPVVQQVSEVDVKALGALLVGNDHALAAAQIAMSKAISPAVLRFARSRYDQEVANRRKLVASASPANIRAALSGQTAVQLHAQGQVQRSRLDHLEGPAFELAYLSDGLQERPLPTATSAVLFAGR